MRPIKFRVWDVEKKRMFPVYGAWFEEQGQYSEEDFSKIANNYGEHILMQYTGLKDKNGKEIYEGDIVKNYEGENYPLSNKGMEKVETIVVEYKTWAEEMSSGIGYQFSWFPEAKDLEVIGNIWENKELIIR